MEQNYNQLPVEANKSGRNLAASGTPGSRRDMQLYKRQPEIINRAIRPTDMIYALRRRWALSLILGFVITTITILVAQLTIPVEYNAKVMLRFAESRPYILFKAPSEKHYLNDRSATGDT